MHRACARPNQERKYKRKYHHMSIPIIVLSTLTGTANFADSYVPDGFKQGFSACVGGLNIFCGILGTLMSFLKYAEVYEAHRIPAVAWSSLGRNRLASIHVDARGVRGARARGPTRHRPPTRRDSSYSAQVEE